MKYQLGMFQKPKSVKITPFTTYVHFYHLCETIPVWTSVSLQFALLNLSPIFHPPVIQPNNYNHERIYPITVNFRVTQFELPA